MDLEIQVNSTENEDKGKYNQLTIGYTDLKSGKDFTYKLMSFLNKDGYELLKAAKRGDKFDVVCNKNDKGYWQWDQITVLGSQVKTQKANPAPRSNYETPEERALKQKYIVRQSSITSAIAMLGNKSTVEQVLQVAQQFEEFVFRVEEDPFQQ